jgi:hypothetical protein
LVLFGVDLFGIYFYALLFLSPDMIFDAFYACSTGAVGAAKECFLCLDSVTDNPASAICAYGRKFMNRTFETIENVAIARRDYFKRQIIIVAANFALCHIFSFKFQVSGFRFLSFNLKPET